MPSKTLFTDLNLNKPLLDALDNLGYQYPTTIQEKAFSVVLSGRDVCGIAQTGTGKTLAYLLPLLRQWQFSKDRSPQFLVLVPTRELVVQVAEVVKQLTAHMSFEVVAAYGGVNMKPQAAACENGCDMVVATPGRLLDLVYDAHLKLKSVKKLIIDEVDEMLNLGFQKQLGNILEMLPQRRQNLLFSATMTEEVEVIMNENFNTPTIIEAAPTGTPLSNISQSKYSVPNFYTKVNLLELLLRSDESMNKVLVFTGTKSLADDVFSELEPKFPEQVGVIHSNKEQNHRFNSVRKFQSGEYRFLIATDIIARGLDIAEVSHVINFDTPEVPEHYIHRIGRTGRADKKGVAIIFNTPREPEQLAAIEGLMNYKIPEVALPDDLEISDVLTDDEKPKVRMKEHLIKLPKRELSGPAFHPKKEKNRKVPTKVKYSDKMKAKYKKPLKRKPKK